MKQEVVPTVISVRAALPSGLYRKGLRNPRTGFPAAIRRSFKRDTILAKMGVEQLVPVKKKSYPNTVSGDGSQASAWYLPRPLHREVNKPTS